MPHEDDELKRVTGEGALWQALARQAPAAFDAVLRSFPGGVWVTDRELRVRAAEGTVVNTPPIRREDWLGRCVAEIAGAPDAEADRAHRRALLGEPASYRIAHGGSVFDVTVQPLRDAAGEITGTLGVAVDRTGEVRERAGWEAELRRREREIRAVAEASPDIIVCYDPALRIRFVNGAAERASGIPRERLVGRSLEEAGFPPALAARWRSDLARALRGETTELEYVYVGPHGPRWMQARGSPERDEAGAVVGVVTTTRDVTEARRREEAVQAADALVRAFFENAAVGIALSDVDGRFVRVNRAYARILGYEPEELLALSVEDLVPPARRAALRERIGMLFASEGGAAAYSVDEEYVRKDGSRAVLRASASLLRDAEGRPTHVVGLVQDLSRERQAEAARRASEQRFRALVENASDLVAIVEADGRLVYVAPSVERVLGVPPDRLVGTSCFDWVHPDDLARHRDALASALGRREPTEPFVYRFRDGRGAWRSLSTIFHDLRGDPAVGGIVANARDVTEQLLLEDRLRQSQKLEALGQLAGGVAHDFNNILAAILMYAQVLRDGLLPGDPRRADAEEIVSGATRGAAIVKQLLAFSRAQPLDTEVLDLVAIVRDTARMLRSLIPASVAMRLPPDGAPALPVRAGRAQLSQIVMNLAVNARDAMPGGGVLSFEAERRAGREGEEAVLAVRDTGHGIAPEAQERIFDPFYTTKPVGQGTGLGLATVYGLVRQIGGNVTVESEAGRGSVFRVVLPIADEAPPRIARGEAAFPGASPHRSVLVVEDEPPIARVARRVLEGAGYRVAVERDGRAALERLRAGEPFDLVLTDAAMPAISGWQLAAEVRVLRPDLPVVLMSGFAEHSGGAGAAARVDIAEFLQKPFTVEELRTVVQRALDRGSSRRLG